MKWELKTLNELGYVGRGKSRHRPRNAEHLYGGIYPLIQTGDIQKANFYITEYSQTYSEDGLAQSKLWNQGTMVISIVGANTAETAILGFDACFPDSVIGFIPDKQKADVKFVKYNLEYLKSHLKSISEGTARENLSLEKLLSIKIPTPPLNIQQKISSILTGYDDLIETNLKRIKLLEEKLMIEYSFLEDESKNLKEYEFSNFVTFIKGIEPGSESYLSERLEGTIPFIRVGDLSKRNSEIFIEQNKSKGIICNPNDVLISMDGTVGIVRYGLCGCYSSGIRKAVSNGVLNNAFIFCYLSSSKIQGVIYSHSKGSTIQHAGSSINHFKIKLPKEFSLENFIRLSNPIYDLMKNLLMQNIKLREARDILLPKLMNRQIEV
ncbi:MAG: restriction endonuclease subunit S [Lentimicrobium sp.]|nr:restriction endonuclease subunit S [Lentimicrobium sp.]